MWTPPLCLEAKCVIIKQQPHMVLQAYIGLHLGILGLLNIAKSTAAETSVPVLS